MRNIGIGAKMDDNIQEIEQQEVLKNRSRIKRFDGVLNMSSAKITEDVMNFFSLGQDIRNFLKFLRKFSDL